MKIAYLLESTEIFGGVQVVLRQAEALARRGHRVTVVSPRAAPEWFPLMQARFERASFRDASSLAMADVLVATFWKTVPAALEVATGPVFHLCQGYEGEIAHYETVRSEIEKIYRTTSTHKLAVSTTLAARLESFGFGPVTDIGQAFDAAGFFPGPTRPPADPPVVLVVGPMEVEFKGIEVALRGLDRWRRGGGRFRLRRISYSPCLDAEKGLGLTDEYHDRLAPERMPFAYRASDVFLGASRAEEGFGLPSLEALACGIPALLSDVSGQREIGGDAAWYFGDGDPESLAAALPQLLTPEARAHARAAGPAAAARYDTAGVAERLERAFLAVLEGKA